MEQPPQHQSSQRSDSGDLFEIPLKETPGDRIKSVFSSHAEPTFTVTLEILTVTVAVVIVLLIVVFYLGFLRGRDVERQDIARKITALKTRQAESYQLQRARAQFVSRPIVPVSAAPSRGTANPASKPSTANVVAKPASSIPKSVANPSKKPYTVQVVAYRSQSRAQSEVTQLTQKGYTARMIVQGTFYVVCVGAYTDRYEAQKDLRALKRIYPSGYLRKF